MGKDKLLTTQTILQIYRNYFLGNDGNMINNYKNSNKAGLLVYCERDGAVYVLCVFHKKSQLYGPPKGGQEDGESDFSATAIREFKEEVGEGLKIDQNRIGNPIKAYRQFIFPVRLPKESLEEYFKGIVIEGNPEVSEAKMFTLGELLAMENVSNATKKIISKFQEKLDSFN